MTPDPLIYLIAGEPSGDRLGGALMAALRAERPGVRFAGIGGRDMIRAGLEPPFDMGELSVMGIAEVIPRLPRLLRRIREVTEDAIARRPDALVTIDSPSFGLRVAERVRRAAPEVRTIHYVAPSVWAWRPGRAKQMARYVDHVLALLPFEPPYMEAAGMTCDFVGHPIAERAPVPPVAAQAFRAAHGLGRRKVLLVAPGSRKSEVARLGPVFLETLEILRAEHPELRAVVPVAETVEAEVRAMFGPTAVLVPPEADEADRRAAFAAADAGLVKSGTVTLEMAAAGVPHVAAYRTSALTAFLVRQLIRTDTGNLVNLATGTRVVPELYQEECTAEALAEAVAPLLADTPARRSQIGAARDALAALGRGGVPPSLRAARSVLSVIDRQR